MICTALKYKIHGQATKRNDRVCQKVLMAGLQCIYTSLQWPHLFVCLLITQIVEFKHPQLINFKLKPVRFYRAEFHNLHYCSTDFCPVEF